MSSTTLFKKSKSDKIQTWTIEQDGLAYRTLEGFVGGAITPTKWTMCTSKNVGKSHQSTPGEQATKEVAAIVKKQREKGWVDTPEQAKITEVVISPMLAHGWDEHGAKFLNKYLACQPKLDGIRCIATSEGLFTRNGKPILSVPHVWEELNAKWGLSDRTHLKIDGELYNHDLKANFNEISSIVRKQKVTSEDIEKSKILKYHIYDHQNTDQKDLTFTQRYAGLATYFDLIPMEHCCLVETQFLVGVGVSGTELDHYYANYLELGYEGQMIRVADSPYENTRSRFLLKRKEFIDDEFTIIDIQEGLGNRSGMMGRIKLQDSEGKIFDSNALGTHEYFTQLLVEKDSFIGKTATVRYQNLTPDGIPRFPVVIKIDRID